MQIKQNIEKKLVLKQENDCLKSLSYNYGKLVCGRFSYIAAMKG